MAAQLNVQQLFKTDVLSAHGYEFLKYLDCGGFGKVVKVREEKGSTPAVRAVKLLIRPDKEAVDRELSMNQVVGSNNQHSDCVVQLLNHFTDNLDQFFVFEFMAEGSLYSWLENRHPQGVGPKTIQTIAWKLFQALDFLEQRSILHGDIKTDNVLLASPDPQSLKLADFGEAAIHRKADAPVVYRFSLQVVNFRAPEVYYQYPTHNVLAPDVWGVGCVLLHAILGRPLFPFSPSFLFSDYLNNYYDYLSCPPHRLLENCPFSDMMEIDRSMFPKENSKELLHHILKTKRWCRSEAIAVYDVLRRTLDLDPETRMGPRGALKHPFLQLPSSRKP